MTFTKRLREGVRRGEITCSVRTWTRPHVTVGKRYRMDEGEIEVDSIEPIGFPDITGELARESGFLGIIDLLNTRLRLKSHSVRAMSEAIAAAIGAINQPTRMTWLLILLVSAIAAPSSQLIDVGDSVNLEVLDWGGTGRPVVLLAGSGNTAHVFEEFAPKLIECCHVHAYGITRRGYGLSSKPERGYSTPDLAEDDLRVIHALKLEKPVLIGHSMAGSEMTESGRIVRQESHAAICK